MIPHSIIIDELAGHGERWLPVVGYEGHYEVSDLGRVRSVDRVTVHGRRRKQKYIQCLQSNPDAYPKLTLCKNGTRKDAHVHVLVLEAFKGSRPDGMHVCHGDGNRSNNALINLRWDTPTSNQRDRVKHGTSCRGEKFWNPKLSNEKVARIFALKKSGYSLKEIAADIGSVHFSTISKVLTGKNWAHICDTP